MDFEDVPDANEQELPTNCPYCGTRLESATIDFDPSDGNRMEMQPGEMAAVSYCPNPDCPAKKDPQP